MKVFLDPECNDLSLESVSLEDEETLRRLVDLLGNGEYNLRLGPIKATIDSSKVWLTKVSSLS